MANSHCRQTHIMNMTHNIWTSAALAPSFFQFWPSSSYFVPHYGRRRASYTVLYRRVLSSHSWTLWLLCSKYVMSISDKQSSSCWSAWCQHNIICVYLVQFALAQLIIQFCLAFPETAWHHFPSRRPPHINLFCFLRLMLTFIPLFVNFVLFLTF